MFTCGVAVTVHVHVKSLTPSGAGYTQVLAEIDGSPCLATPYRVLDKSVNFYQGDAAITPIDDKVRMAFPATLGVKANMQVTMPDGETFLIKRVRGAYTNSIQVDLEAGTL